MIRHKIIRPQTKVIDADKGTVTAVVSTEAEDRDGDIIRAAGWKLGNFNAHPVLLSSHDYRKLQSQIGEWESMRVDRTNNTLEGTARYYIGEGNAEADWGFNLAAKGRAAFSVGFIPDMSKAKPRGDDPDTWVPSYEFNGQELLEVSHVTIPSNPEALQAMKRLGRLHPVVDELVEEMSDGERRGDDALWEQIERYIDEKMEDIQAALDTNFNRIFAALSLRAVVRPESIDYRDLAGEEIKNLLEAR